MKQLINQLLFGRNSKFSGLIAFAIVASIALGCTCGKNFDLANAGKNDNSAETSSSDNPFSTDDDSGLPDETLLKALVRETTADFAYAISTEDFSKMYSKSSQDFQRTYTEAQMKDVFKEFIQKKKIILPILAKTVSLEPEFSPSPSIRTENNLDILVTDGKYSTKPVPMTFEYEYVKRGGQWKLLKLIIKLT